MCSCNVHSSYRDRKDGAPMQLGAQLHDMAAPCHVMLIVETVHPSEVQLAETCM
jgi:hypothetical protein